MSDGSPCFCGLLPHAPILIPALAGRRAAECEATTSACRRLARMLMASRPRRLLLVSPHAPRRGNGFGLWLGRRLRGTLSLFGCGAGVDLPNDEDLLSRLEESELNTWAIPTGPLDHGAVVPLWFLAEAGWEGPTAVVSLPQWSDPRALVRSGAVLGALLREMGEPFALIASGDMSHRAAPGAPEGFHPRAVEFDRAMVEHVAGARLVDLAGLDPDLRTLAAEDAADSTILVAAAIGEPTRGTRPLSYEHPFGVGYLVAVLHDATGTADRAADAWPGYPGFRSGNRQRSDGR